MPRKIEISHRTIVFTVFFLMLLWFLFFIRDILLQLFIALLLMAILNPFVSRLAHYKVPRAISILLVYVGAIGAMVLALAGIVPPLVEQTTFFVNNVPKLVDQFASATPLGDQIVEEILSQLARFPSQVARLVVGIFSNVASVITVLIFAFYLLLERDRLDDNLVRYFGDAQRKKIENFLDHLEEKLGGWMRGQLTLMGVVALSTYIGLIVVGIPFALPLAILAGLFELVPYVGPILSAIPAVIIGFGISPFMGLAAAAVSFLVQQLENYVFVPKVMQKTAGVSPIITLLALAIGFKVAGIAGVVISVPVVVTLGVVLNELVMKK